jgi:hypothetical protein
MGVRWKVRAAPSVCPAVITAHHGHAVARQVQARQRPAQGKVFVWSAGVDRGRRWARRGSVGLTEDGGRWRGGASGFGQQRSVAAGELWWPVVTAVWSCSLEEEGRGEAVP